MYVRHPVRKTVIVFVIFSVVLTVGYGIYWKDESDRKRDIIEVGTRFKIQTLLETSAKLQKACEAYEESQRNAGKPLVPGNVISLAELKVGDAVQVKELEKNIHIDDFFYEILPDNAAKEAVKMVLVSDRGRVVVRKDGKGSLYDR